MPAVCPPLPQAFNDAYHRYGSRHEYMAFFDFDEYLWMDRRFLSAALAQGVSPLRMLLSTYRGDVDAGVYMFVNRWTFLLPVVPLGAPITREAVMERTLLGGTFGDYASRTKFFVRAGRGGGGGGAAAAAAVGGRGAASTPTPPPYMIGNHYVCSLVQRDIISGRATEQWSGRCVQPVEPVARLVPARDAFSLHVTNLKPHVSLLGVDEDAMLATALANPSASSVEEIHYVLDRYGAFSAITAGETAAEAAAAAAEQEGGGDSGTTAKSPRTAESRRQ